MRAPRGKVLASACALAAALVLVLAGCSAPHVDDDSPRVAEVALSASSDMTEASQAIEIKATFDRPVSVSGDGLGDVRLLLNGAEPDASVVDVSARASAEGITFTLRPAPGVQGVGKGAYFAVYQAQFSLSSVRGDGALPSVVGASGSCAVLDGPIEGTLPSGMAIEVGEVRAGSVEEGVAAQTTFTVTSPATVRAITWFSPDGGQTKLLRHNHTFCDDDAEACAAGLADIVNAAGLGLHASANGAEVTIAASKVEEGQVIEPVIIEGVGATGGTYDASMAEQF